MKQRPRLKSGLTEILGEIQSGSYVEPTGKTFSAWSEEWLRGRVNVKGSTWENYHSYLKNHVNPFLGSYKLTDIRHAHVQKLVAHLCGKNKLKGKDQKLSANTIGKVITMLKTVFKSAVKNNLIRLNPALDVELPKVIKAKIQPPTKEQIRAILDKASQRLG